METNADGRRIPVMTEEQKFRFDLKGWILLPAVLTVEETETLRQHVSALHANPESLPETDRYPLSGPAQMLLDHPAVASILREILAADKGEDCYGFRCENSFYMYRSCGETGLEPHGGGLHPGFFHYQCRERKIFSGLTRAVWELNDVGPEDGGTLVMSGSHKNNFPIPDEHLQFDSPLFETYSCPAGSLLIFSEAICHAGPTWKNANHPRVSIFNCYNDGVTQFHKLNLPECVIRTMPPKRRTLFRGSWAHDFTRNQPNDYFASDNMAL